MTNTERASRADEVRQERRRKPGSTVHYGQKLSIEEKELDRRTYEYRWVNDAGNRVKNLEAQDWDIAPLGDASVESRHVGTDSGHPTNAVLMRKRKDWYDKDQQDKRRPLDEMDQAIRAGTAHAKSGDADLNAAAYTPGTGNSITR